MSSLASGALMVLIGLWVILQTTKGGLLERLGVTS
jgi:hypothetical protein